MAPFPKFETPGGRRVDWPALAYGAVLAAAAAAAYSRTFSVPMFYDDVPSIINNPTLRHLGSAFWPGGRSTVSGRPVLNLSLALNYAASGTSVWGYHAVNLAIHAMSGLVLFGIIRRTLAPREGERAPLVAFLVAILWALHPLLTESVTYVIQRAESLMGLFYLLTLYAFIRGASDGSRTWYSFSVAFCLLGMGTKEVMVSAPLIVLLYDRTFLAGSFGEAWRRRRGVYAGLAATWLVVPFLVLSTHGRGGTAGFGTDVPWWSYALTQLHAVVLYLRLSFWPHPLVFDYGSSMAPLNPAVIPYAVAVAGLAAATAWALVRRPEVGFLGACFFAILAPSSSVVPVVTESMAEHRMYLPLIPVVALAVLAIHRWMGRAAVPICLALAVGLFWATWDRNEVYATEKGVWSDTVASLPQNERAQNNLGNMLAKEPGRLDEAIARFEEALRLEPGYADAHFDLGLALSRIPGRRAEAVSQYETALNLEPSFVEAHNNLGLALMDQGRVPEAIAQFQDALSLEPGHTKAHYNLGNALSATGRTREAIAQYEEALRLDPAYVEAHFNLGNELASMGRTREAIAQYESAVRMRPGFADAHYNLGSALIADGRDPDAIAEFEDVIRLRPDDASAHLILAAELLKFPGRTGAAAANLREVLRLDPGNVQAAKMMARIDFEAR